MAVKIRLARAGAKKRPYYKLVVANADAPRDGKFLEKVGTYNPMLPKDDENRVVLVQDRIKYWMSVVAVESYYESRKKHNSKHNSKPPAGWGIGNANRRNRDSAGFHRHVRRDGITAG